MGEAIAFYALATLILGFGILVISVRNIVHSVLFLVADLLLVAALYVTLAAEFLAVIQILVYAGGIVVLYLFVVMLVRLKRPELHADRRRLGVVGLLLAGAVLLELVGIAVYSASQPMLPAPGAARGLPIEGGNTENLGWVLYTDYLIPFEVASMLLLVAMIGAIVLAKREAGAE
jgi:NADH-quinone oxidoreductase subunit J